MSSRWSGWLLCRVRKKTGLKSETWGTRFCGSTRGVKLIDLAREIEEYAEAGEGEEDRCPAVRDERERDAFRRHQGEDHADVEEGLHQHSRGNAEGEEACKGILRETGRAHAAIAEHHKEADDDDCPDEAEFLCDVREDEVRMRFGQIEKFLPAFHEAEAVEAARTHSDKRLDGVEAGLLRVLPWIQKGEHAVATPGHAEEHVVQDRSCGDCGDAEPLHLRAGEIQHHERDRGAHHGSAEVGLFQDKRDEEQAGQHRRQQRIADVFDVLHAVLQEPRKEEHQRGLG